MRGSRQTLPTLLEECDSTKLLCEIAATTFDQGQAYSNSKVYWWIVELSSLGKIVFICIYIYNCYRHFISSCLLKRGVTNAEELSSPNPTNWTLQLWPRGQKKKTIPYLDGFCRTGDRFCAIPFVNAMKDRPDFFDRQQKMQELLFSREKPFGWTVRNRNS